MIFCLFPNSHHGVDTVQMDRLRCEDNGRRSAIRTLGRYAISNECPFLELAALLGTGKRTARASPPVDSGRTLQGKERDEIYRDPEDAGQVEKGLPAPFCFHALPYIPCQFSNSLWSRTTEIWNRCQVSVLLRFTSLYQPVPSSTRCTDSLAISYIFSYTVPVPIPDPSNFRYLPARRTSPPRFCSELLAPQDRKIGSPRPSTRHFRGLEKFFHTLAYLNVVIVDRGLEFYFLQDSWFFFPAICIQRA